MGELNKRTGGVTGPNLLTLDEMKYEMFSGSAYPFMRSITLPDGLLWSDVRLGILCCGSSGYGTKYFKIEHGVFYGASADSFYDFSEYITISGSKMTVDGNRIYEPRFFFAQMK